MERFVSVIIPNYNGSATIETCLGAALSSDYPSFEVIVVDDCSVDNSTELIGKFPCRLLKLQKHAGAARARNVGVLQSKGDILFFTDADCVLGADTLSRAVRSIEGRENSVIGGTYTEVPHDDTFFSTFQSIFVHYSETKRSVPDYIATHAMVITRELFDEMGGFDEDFLPILEDVEFCHRIRRSGRGLIMDPCILVNHIFNFTLLKSLRNAFRKSTFWTEYSLNNRDILADSGTASIELKVNVASLFTCILLLLLFRFSGEVMLLSLIPFVALLNLVTNRGLIRAFLRTKGFSFMVTATTYYAVLYPLAVGAGASAGVWRSLRSGQGP